jgi:hypothetical protein
MNNVNGRSIKITRGLACVIISVITYLLAYYSSIQFLPYFKNMHCHYVKKLATLETR